jgi:hypothetical protein
MRILINTYMKTITKTITLYKFDELSKEQQQKAVDNLRDINVDHDWWEFTYEDAERIGLKITSFDLDRNRHANGELLNAAEDVARKIIEEHGKDTETYKLAEQYLKDYKKIEPLYLADDESFDDLYSELNTDFLSSLLEEYSVVLQNEYEYLCSDESVIETIEANDYDFTKDGKIY